MNIPNVLVINGPNLNMLGVREPNIYGKLTLNQLIDMIDKEGRILGINIDFFQSNIEGEIINCIHAAIDRYNGIIINPGAFTHYSYAIRDAIASVNIPTIEVHLTNLHNREDFRNISVIAPVCVGQVSGLKENSYIAALYALYKIFNNHK